MKWPLVFGVLAVCALPHATCAEPAALVQLTAAKQQTLSPEITVYGTVVPDPDYLSTVAVPRDCTVTAVSVRAGQLVHVGDPIVTIQTAPSALAVYMQANSAVAFAQKDLAHTRVLYAQQLATKSQLASAERALADARALAGAQIKIGAGRTTEVLRAEVPGIVTALSASPGDRIQANAVIASIATRDHLLVNLGLEPQDAFQVPIGANVWLHSAQHQSISFMATVQSVDAMLDAKSRLVNAIVGVPQAVANRLVLGMALQGTVRLSAQSGIVVPHNALMFDRGGTYVFVVKKGVAHRRVVQLKLETGDKALIASGVKADEEVVTAGNAGLDDGTHVRVR